MLHQHLHYRACYLIKQCLMVISSMQFVYKVDLQLWVVCSSVACAALTRNTCHHVSCAAQQLVLWQDQEKSHSGLNAWLHITGFAMTGMKEATKKQLNLQEMLPRQAALNSKELPHLTPATCSG